MALASTSRLSYSLEPDGLAREEIVIIEESVREKRVNREVADEAEIED